MPSLFFLLFGFCCCSFCFGFVVVVCLFVLLVPFSFLLTVPLACPFLFLSLSFFLSVFPCCFSPSFLHSVLIYFLLLFFFFFFFFFLIFRSILLSSFVEILLLPGSRRGAQGQIRFPSRESSQREGRQL